MEINLTPEQINEYVCTKILESSIGEAIQKTCDDRIKHLSASYNNPFNKIVDNHISNCLKELLDTEFKDQFRAAIRKKISEDTVEAVVEGLWKSIRLDVRNY